jgi:spoIIIJ-associated protein
MTDELNDAESAATDGAIVLNTDQRVALTLMQEVCAASGLDASPVVRKRQGPYLHIDLVGSDARTTWGRFGPSLDALQFLCNLILSHRNGSDVRLVLDADNYRERREAILKQRAIELAKEVKARNEEAELEPLPAHERRIIHSALADDAGVSTYSEGDEPDRRVIIAPRR